MSEKFHSAWVCEKELVQELAGCLTEALKRRDSTPLQAFWNRHAAERKVALDAHRSAIELRQWHPAIEALEGAATNPRIERLLAAMKDVPTEEEVHTRACRWLVRRARRVAMLARMSVPEMILAKDIALAEFALESLTDGRLSERTREAGDWAPGTLPESALGPAYECLSLTCVPGWDDDYGLGAGIFALAEDDFMWCPDAGVALFDSPVLGKEEELPGNLFADTVTRYGVCTEASAHALLAEYRRDVCEQMVSYLPPMVIEGEALTRAAGSLEDVSRSLSSRAHGATDDTLFAEDLARFQEKVPALKEALTFCREQGHALVEWTELQ